MRSMTNCCAMGRNWADAMNALLRRRLSTVAIGRTGRDAACEADVLERLLVAAEVRRSLWLTVP